MPSINTPIVNIWSQSSFNTDVSFFTFYNNYVYVPNQNGNITQTNLNGVVITTNWLSSSFTPGQFFACLAYNGSLYVSNYNGNRIIRIIINNDGTSGASSIFISGLSSPMGLSVGTANDVDYLYVTSYANGQISKINLSTATIDSGFTASIASNSIGGSCVYQGYLYVPSYGGGAIKNLYKFSLTDGAGGIWQSSNSNSSPGYLTYPTGSVIWNGYIYVSNWYNGVTNGQYINKISLTYPNIDYTSDWVTPSTANDSLSGPSGMAINNSYLYVLNYYSKYIYSINLPPPCFKEGSKILTAKGYVPIEDLRKGDYVRTFKNGFVPVDIIGKREIYHEACEQRIPGQLYECSKEQFEELIEPLVITGCHSILVDEFVSEEQREKTIEVNGKIYSTDDKYRLPACVDERTTVYSVPGNYTIYHFALENENYYGNYGIYANGLLVESCSKRYLKELAVMDLIE